jgi:hypothetical protein
VLLENCTTAPGVQEPPNREQNLKFALFALLICEKPESLFSAVFYYNPRPENGVIALPERASRTAAGLIL